MNALSIVKYVFSAIGIALLAGAIFFYQNTSAFLADALSTSGTVIDLARSRSSDSTTYRPVVEFKTHNGERVEFTSTSGSNPPSYSKGEIVTVLYSELRPEKARIQGFFSLWGMPAIFGGLGAVFATIGFSIILFGRLKQRNITYLKQHGVKIKTRFQSVERNRAYRVNGQSPYRIHTQWKNPGTAKLHVFKSENLWFDPTDHIDRDEITVIIARNNPKKYYVDTSFLPELAS
jgi:hypothetical protein